MLSNCLPRVSKQAQHRQCIARSSRAAADRLSDVDVKGGFFGIGGGTKNRGNSSTAMRCANPSPRVG